jgi:hypothetical protein
MAGLPWLTKVPILKYLFGQEDKQRQENEIVFAITPHIVRSQEINDDNLRLVDLGRGASVSVGHSDPRRAASPVRVPGSMEQTQSPNAPNRTAPQKAVTPPAAAPKTEPSRAPAQIPSAATTTTMVRPVKATMEEQNLPPFEPQKPPPKQPDADPCPYGMHSIGSEYGVLNCAFN